MVWKKKQFWGSIIAVGLLAYCVKDIRPAEVRALAQRLDYFYLALTIVASFLFVIMKGLRWKLMTSQQKKMGAKTALSLYSAGQALNIIMPALTGQVGRMFLFSTRTRLRKTFVFSTIVLEVLFDAISLVIFLLLVSVAFVFPEKYRSLSAVIASITIAALALFYILLHFQANFERAGVKHLRPRWPGFYITVKKFFRSFTKGLELLKSTQHFGGSMLYSVASWAVHTAVVYFLLKSFGFGLPIAAAASVMIINTLALMIPITPGNAGTFEVAVSKSLAAFRVGASDAVLFALALHIMDLLPIVVMGVYYMKAEHVSLREIKRQHEDEVILDKVTEEGDLIEEEETV
jgi:uncharacterized protein (TIRG00374 family)